MASRLAFNAWINNSSRRIIFFTVSHILALLSPAVSTSINLDFFKSRHITGEFKTFNMFRYGMFRYGKARGNWPRDRGLKESQSRLPVIRILHMKVFSGHCMDPL
ncbi:hypothetical protein F4825DRAFT_408717 [Nemania diffusa]|nr:hypothetical protein F4825DRAFT_408717 [Nemania diffusa]